MPRQPHLETMLTQPEPDNLGVQEFLDGFAEALTAGDEVALAEMWAVPAFVIGDQIEQALNSADEARAMFGGAKANYNAMGIVDTKAEIVRLDEISDKLVSVRVRWPHMDAKGREVGAECSTYTLKRDADGEWKLRVALMHGVEAVN